MPKPIPRLILSFLRNPHNLILKPPRHLLFSPLSSSFSTTPRCHTNNKSSPSPNPTPLSRNLESPSTPLISQNKNGRLPRIQVYHRYLRIMWNSDPEKFESRYPRLAKTVQDLTAGIIELLAMVLVVWWLGRTARDGLGFDPKKVKEILREDGRNGEIGLHEDMEEGWGKEGVVENDEVWFGEDA